MSRLCLKGSWLAGAWLFSAMWSISSGCDESSKDVETDAGPDTESNADSGPDPSFLESHCPGDFDITENGYDCILEGKITAEKVASPDALIWVPGVRYILDGIVSVEASTTLTIEPGTLIVADPDSPDVSPSSLFIAQGSSIHAVGSPKQPIVFTSAKPPGDRAPGDWGGVVIRGKAPVNGCGEGVVCSSAGGNLYESAYGGEELTDSSGAFAYVRIEFGGRTEANLGPVDGFQLLGVGSKTDIHHIQIHRSAANGIAVRGGTVPLSRVLVTGASGNALYWSNGWNGRAQFLVLHHLDGSSLNGMKGRNATELGREDNPPRSNPTIYNVTISGSESAALNAMQFSSGTAGNLANVLVVSGAGFAHCVDIQDDSTWNQAESGVLTINGSMVPDTGCFADDSTMGDLESAWWNGGQENRIAGVTLPAEDGSFALAPGSPALTGAVSPPLGVPFFENVSFVGAVGADDWTAGWTAFPLN